MADPVAQIRPYSPEDRKLVQFMVSKANLQALAVANNKAYAHPLTIAIWAGLSSLMIYWLKWWPADQHGWMEYLKPLPALASIAVPIMFFIDWINRPFFEEMTQEILRYPDLADISKYYFQQPSSGLWLLEYGQTFVGLIAMDAATPSGKTKKIEKQPKTAVIRHFYVEEQFRPSKIQDDLLKYAVDHAFNNDPKLERIEASDSPLVSYLRPCLRSAGFELDHHTKKVGILQWNLGVRYLDRETWSKKAN
ncbi:hypothetical protein JR316_0000953 [Psilocybe cubensis]|uniref:Uncharacterized protein n=2 Tax=Psilocybe cubensis TaxID=181762 RepID=A0ACB8HFU9_PSICU|nr:hypothetical protein JR316_0000953 [Psilocybe cubensis]KAH9486888.1 hypothetical protein JR316_0000953 [Psilocybe cubensis]